MKREMNAVRSEDGAETARLRLSGSERWVKRASLMSMSMSIDSS
jgi:hypothetical protein